MTPPLAAIGATAETVRDLGERALIARITARLSTPAWAKVGPGDDAAVIEMPKRTLAVLTTDAFVEGVHFDRRFCPPDAIGHKALAVNLSDLAAMGAAPHAALLSLVLPDDLPVTTLDAMLDGMLALAGRHRIAIVGGNITRSFSRDGGIGSGPLVIDVTATGAVGPRRVLRRGGARPGDDVFVSGRIGAGAVGLRSLQAQAGAFTGAGGAGGASGVGGAGRPGEAEAHYLRPEPRTRLGVLLGRNRAATACMDLSDGLADAVRQVAEASTAGMVIDADALPIDGAVRRWHAERGVDPVSAAMAGGDDYELLFTVRASQRGRLRSVRREIGDLPLTKIGVVTSERALVVRSASGDRPLPEGFEHFK